MSRETELYEALREAIYAMEDMIEYVPEYFRTKWQHDDAIKDAREVLNKEATDAD